MSHSQANGFKGRVIKTMSGVFYGGKSTEYGCADRSRGGGGFPQGRCVAPESPRPEQLLGSPFSRAGKQKPERNCVYVTPHGHAF